MYVPPLLKVNSIWYRNGIEVVGGGGGGGGGGGTFEQDS